VNKKAAPDVHVPQIVVTYLGRISAGIMLMGGLLVWRIVELSSSSAVATDAAVVALVSAFIGYGGGALSALGAILASTRGSTPTPVAVVNPPSDPVNTSEATAGVNPVVDIHPDAPETSDL